MIDHLGLRVSDYAKSKRFFESALAPLGYKVVMEFGGSTAGLGAEGKPDFWISEGGPVARAPGIRPEYHANYYGAFVYDPDGNNIEGVCHHPG
jgi:catechol 2,3-dioxygenase-like lactoylglutathione lyase family enzyme